METVRGPLSRRFALRLALVLVAIFAFWQASQPSAACSQYGPGNYVDANMPLAVGGTPIVCTG